MKLHEGFPPNKVRAAFMTFPHLQGQGPNKGIINDKAILITWVELGAANWTSCTPNSLYYF